MVTGNPDIIRRYLEEAVAAENTFEERLRVFSSEGDDEEVKAAFLTHAGETRSQSQRLAKRLEEIGGNPHLATSPLSLTARVNPIAHAEEEQLVQNLIAAYTVEAAECALYQVLIELARADDDETTANLARDIQKEAHNAADKFWSFIPSRSIIAYNMLTIGEVDPAVETKVGETSWS